MRSIITKVASLWNGPALTESTHLMHEYVLRLPEPDRTIFESWHAGKKTRQISIEMNIDRALVRRTLLKRIVDLRMSLVD